jgi:hypothetical protein
MHCPGPRISQLHFDTVNHSELLHMMDADQLSSILELAKKDEAGFCLRVASDLTVRARGLYDLGSDESVVLYQAFNELLHLSVNQAFNASHGIARYKLEDFLEILVKTAEQRGVGRAMQAALEFVLARSTRGKPE